MKRSLPLLMLLFCAHIQTRAQHFSTDKDFYSAYSRLLDLDFAEASRKIQSMRMADEQNLAVLYLEDLSDFLFIVVKEDKAYYERSRERKDERIELVARLDPDSPYRLLTEAEIHLHWAFSDMRFGAYLSAAKGINKAYHLLEKNIREHPEFLPSYKSMGLLHTLIGTVPENYRWATKLMGVEGTVDQGIHEMEKVLLGTQETPEYAQLRKETLFLLTFLHINLLNDPESLQRFLQLVQQESGPLMDFARASLLRRSARTDEAIQLLSTSPASMSAFPYLYFLLGEMKLSRMDQDADVPLRAYLHTFKGTSYKKSAQQKLAWHALVVLNDAQAYRKRIAKVDELEGSMLDEDRSAQNEFESGEMPNQALLRSRLQFDGGYYKEALRTLINVSADSLNSEDERLEFTYRLGRIHQELGNLKDALSYYGLTIEMGKDSKRYFAANASLMKGLIHENLGELSEARAAFEACSQFNNSEYRNSINQKARAGLLRLSD